MEIKPLFPTLVAIAKADQATINAISEEVIQQKPFLESLLRFSWGDNVLTSFELEKNIFAAAKLHALKQFVEQNMIEFVQATREQASWRFDENYTQSWVNITRKYGFQERHNHERNVDGLPISGVYYFNTNGLDGALSVCPGDLQYKYFGNFDVEPEVGKLVLFRSEVFHRVAANLTDSDRVSFAFNYLLVKASAA
jgi:hypothetical protein